MIMINYEEYIFRKLLCKGTVKQQKSRQKLDISCVLTEVCKVSGKNTSRKLKSHWLKEVKIQEMDFATDKTVRKWGERIQKGGNNKMWGSKICKKPATKSLDDPECTFARKITRRWMKSNNWKFERLSRDLSWCLQRGMTICSLSLVKFHAYLLEQKCECEYQ